MDSEIEDVDLDAVPVRALNISSRMTLSWFLNPEQSLCSNRFIARDYRGLAEQMDFTNIDIKNFQRHEDPTSKILEAWELRYDSTVGQLVKFLENMGRYDILEDVMELFKADAFSFLNRKKQMTECNEFSPIQVPEVSSGPSFSQESSNDLTISDYQSEEPIIYDAYVCYADADYQFVCMLASYLEDPQIGLKLYIRDRDLLMGQFNAEADVKLLNERCNRVLIILSPDFIRSPSCAFQISYAASLGIEQRKRKLIPLIIAPCETPHILKYLSKIECYKPDPRGWQWTKLVHSLRSKKEMFVALPSDISSGKELENYFKPQLTSTFASIPVITYPPTISVPSTSNSRLVMSSNSISEVSTSTSVICDGSASRTLKTSSSPLMKNKWLQNIKQKLPSFNSHSSNHSSVSSTVTSGFFSDENSHSDHEATV